MRTLRLTGILALGLSLLLSPAAEAQKTGPASVGYHVRWDGKLQLRHLSGTYTRDQLARAGLRTVTQGSRTVVMGDPAALAAQGAAAGLSPRDMAKLGALLSSGQLSGLALPARERAGAPSAQPPIDKPQATPRPSQRPPATPAAGNQPLAKPAVDRAAIKAQANARLAQLGLARPELKELRKLGVTYDGKNNVFRFAKGADQKWSTQSDGSRLSSDGRYRFNAATGSMEKLVTPLASAAAALAEPSPRPATSATTAQPVEQPKPAPLLALPAAKPAEPAGAQSSTQAERAAIKARANAALAAMGMDRTKLNLMRTVGIRFDGKTGKVRLEKRKWIAIGDGVFQSRDGKYRFHSPTTVNGVGQKAYVEKLGEASTPIVLPAPAERKALPAPARQLALPAPAERKALPAPARQLALPAPETKALPAPAKQLALPAPAELKALPAPAKQLALPAPAERKALPAPARQLALPAPAELKALPAPAKQLALPAPAERKALPAPARQLALLAPAERKALPAPAKQLALPAPAERKALPAPAKQLALPAPAERKALPAPAKQLALLAPAETKALPAAAKQTRGARLASATLQKYISASVRAQAASNYYLQGKKTRVTDLRLEPNRMMVKDGKSYVRWTAKVSYPGGSYLASGYVLAERAAGVSVRDRVVLASSVPGPAIIVR